ncbi:MAG: exosortase H [candidate division Zixibacteria bacterium]|nr:exosortase H [candidate division Zixibacteria bacterium]
MKIKKPVIKSLIKLYLSFGGMIILFVIAFHIKAVHHAVVVPFTEFVAICSSLLMNALGAGAQVTDNNLFTVNFRINVVDGCNGIYATAILISGVIAYPSKIIHRLYGILLGTFAIFVLNLIRVISLFYLGQYFPDIFQEVHVYVWQPIIILWAIFIWDFWSRKITAKNL